MTTPATLDEGARLVARHRDGDAAAFSVLVERYRAPIYGYLIRCGIHSPVADDLFQETFMRVHQHAHRYKPDRPFRVWLFTITSNLVKSHFRKQKVRSIMTSLWRSGSDRDPHGGARELDPEDVGPDPEENVAAREELRWLTDALEALPPNWSQALILTKVEGMSVEQASEVLGAPLSTVKTWVRRGRLALAKARALELQGVTP